jgi:CDAN1-interacting nuclease 1
MQKAAVGAAYEAKLEAELSSAGIAFASEAALRLDGFARTPDVRLEVPVAVRGRVVYWIDSKASFADPGVHAEKGLPQFQAYVNRYGPGLVIYWMGYVAELDTHPQVQLASAFPSPAEIRQLASFPAAPAPAEEAAEETPS